jgi:hypothetical protein
MIASEPAGKKEIGSRYNNTTGRRQTTPWFHTHTHKHTHTHAHTHIHKHTHTHTNTQKHIHTRIRPRPRPRTHAYAHAHAHVYTSRVLRCSQAREAQTTHYPVLVLSLLWLGLARTVCMHRIWPYIWWFPCQKYRIYTVHIWFWPTLPATHNK